MPLQIIREDISRMAVDAIVAAGNDKPGTPAPTGGVNGAIHKRAGEKLLAALRRLGGIHTGGATLTEGYYLPCRYVIHTAGPVWRGGDYGEEKMLRACYRKALALAAKHGLESIAFPLISAGHFGYPKAEAMQVAVSEIRAFLRNHDMLVYLVVYDRESFHVGSELFTDVEQFIDQHYVDLHYVTRNRREDDWVDIMPPLSGADAYGMDAYAGAAWDGDTFGEATAGPCPTLDSFEWTETVADEEPFNLPASEPLWDADMEAEIPQGLAKRLQQLDEGFTEMLLRLIDERGMKDSACYRKANVDRKLFSKIRSIPGYRPKKSTVMAFCVALELDMPACRELLSRAGYAMSRSNMFDVIVEYFILKGKYDVDLINQVLYAYDQPQLGSNIGM